jgi:hypothetical protein
MTAEVNASQVALPGAVVAAPLDHDDPRPWLYGEEQSQPADPSLPHSDLDCGVNAAIARHQISALSALNAPLAVASAEPLPVTEPGESLLGAALPATAPPGVRRALLQVYLI